MNARNLCKFGLREARLCQHFSDILLHIHVGIICYIAKLCNKKIAKW